MKITTEKLAALNTALKGTFKQAFEETSSDYEKVATTIPSSKKSNTYDWIGQTINIREWAGDRVIQNLTEYDYTIKNKKFEGTVAIKKDDIEDDEVGKYNIIMKELAYGAKTHPDSLIFGELLKNGTSTVCYDGQYFFDTDHDVGGESVSNFTTGSGAAWYLLNTARPLKPLIWQPRTPANLVTIDNEEAEPVFKRGEILYGVDFRGNAGYGFWQMAYCSKQDLTTANFNTVYAAMMSMKQPNGKPLNNRPTLLVVPPSLRAAAKTVIESEKLADGTTNPNKGVVEILVSPWLA